MKHDLCTEARANKCNARSDLRRRRRRKIFNRQVESTKSERRHLGGERIGAAGVKLCVRKGVYIDNCSHTFVVPVLKISLPCGCVRAGEARWQCK